MSRRAIGFDRWTDPQAEPKPQDDPTVIAEANVELGECEACGKEVPESELESSMVFAGSREEPPEWVELCSKCHPDNNFNEPEETS